MPRMSQAELNAYEARHRGKFPTTLSAVPGCDDEGTLQKDIEDYCKGRGWICLRSRMDMATTRMPGEPDLEILCPEGKTLRIECKTAKGKCTSEQLGFHQLAERLGHKVYVVRNLDGFFAAMTDGGVR